MSQYLGKLISLTYEPRCEKTGLWGFRPGPTQTRLCSHRRWLEASNFGFRKKRDCTIRVAKTKALISFVVTAKLICVFVFAYAKKLVLSQRGSIKFNIHTTEISLQLCMEFFIYSTKNIYLTLNLNRNIIYTARQNLMT